MQKIGKDEYVENGGEAPGQGEVSWQGSTPAPGIERQAPAEPGITAMTNDNRERPTAATAVKRTMTLTIASIARP